MGVYVYFPSFRRKHLYVYTCVRLCICICIYVYSYIYVCVCVSDDRLVCFYFPIFGRACAYAVFAVAAHAARYRVHFSKFEIGLGGGGGTGSNASLVKIIIIRATVFVITENRSAGLISTRSPCISATVAKAGRVGHFFRLVKVESLQRKI